MADVLLPFQSSDILKLYTENAPNSIKLGLDFQKALGEIAEVGHGQESMHFMVPDFTFNDKNNQEKKLPGFVSFYPWSGQMVSQEMLPMFNFIRETKLPFASVTELAPDFTGDPSTMQAFITIVRGMSRLQAHYRTALILNRSDESSSLGRMATERAFRLFTGSINMFTAAKMPLYDKVDEAIVYLATGNSQVKS